jgi:hypothetical protein
VIGLLASFAQYFGETHHARTNQPGSNAFPSVKRIRRGLLTQGLLTQLMTSWCVTVLGLLLQNLFRSVLLY